jgi:hypothetical protein
MDHQSDSSEHLLVADQMLWFGTQLPNSLINPNQLRAYGLSVNDNPFDTSSAFGIDSENLFIPFDTTGTPVVHFDTRVPTEWEKSNLPVVLLTGEDWNPLEEVLRPNLSTREEKEMRTIKSLMTRQVNSTNVRCETNIRGKTDISLGKISRVYDEQEFRDGLISAVHIATLYHEDIDKIENECKACAVISNEHHSKVTPEELSQKWSIGLQTVKDTLRVTTQKGIWTAIHPMT